MSKASWMNYNGVTLVGNAAITAATDRLSITAHGLADGDLITVDTRVGGGTELREATEYVVRNPTANDFQISAPAGAAPFNFAADGTCNVYRGEPAYSALDMRRADAITLHPASVDRTGAREGVRPHSTDPVTLLGTGYTVTGGLAVVYPRETSTSAPYRVYYDAESGTLTPADGSNPRRDAIDLQVQDHDEDGQGQRRARIVYVTGNPAASPTDPTPTDNSLRLATILVPAGGSPAPSIATPVPYAFGPAPIPVRTTAERPTTGLFSGTTVFRQDIKTFEVYDGSAWQGYAAAGAFQYLTTVYFDANGTFTKATYPNLRAVMVHCQGGGGAGGGAVATAATGASAGGGGQGGNYARKFVLESALLASETVTRGAGGTGVTSTNGNNGGTSSFGAHCSAGGGVGGVQVASTTSTWVSSISGVPSTTATGDFIRLGDAGGFGLVNGNASFALGGCGGSALWGSGGQARQPGGGQPGFPGNVYGGGGGGGGNWNSQGSGKAGGAGANGRVWVDLYV